ncbi:hypothetical protein [Streptomyces sp. t39]|uniref:hypothetical protein n=1 Tax=Streptomyces sp. t39 TaxID=1828156 RepID=UPI0011CDBD39|nr:hypothetical protein [Streptomyces sp. t39]TXS35096.1 hypothetical protein EAO77_38015 [Streptomyces sp. t39]
MTDTMPEQTENNDWSQAAPAVTYPENGPLPEARFSVTFKPGGAPMLTVRAHTAVELTAALQELEEANVYNAVGMAHSSLGAQVAVGAGLGPATQMPAGPPALPGAPTPPPFGPNVSVPGAPGFQGGAPALPQPPAAPAQASPEYRQAGWYRLTVPYPQKAQFDGIVAQYQLRKGRPSEGGQLSWNKAEKSWMVSPEAAGAFPNFNPVPA